MTLKKTKMRIIGLGNAGPQYRDTYHNAGFLFIDWAAEKFGAAPEKKGVSRLELPDGRLVELIKPQGFMNLSGPSLNGMLNRKELSKAAVVHDDSDIIIGSYKISFARGAAGHKGILSIMETFKTKDFLRARIGIRPDLPARAKAGDFVLKKISAENRAVLEKVFEPVWNELLKKLSEETA